MRLPLRPASRVAVVWLVLQVAVGLLRPTVAAARTPPVGAAVTAPASPATPGPGDADPALYDAVLPGERDGIVAATAGRLSRYRIDATLTPGAENESGTIAGRLDLRFVNDTGGELAELYFRLYANNPTYADAALAVDDLTVAGSPVAGELSVDDTVLRVPLPAPLADGAAIDLNLGFAATVPVNPRDTYGIFAVHPSNGTWALAHWFPLLAGRDVNGWNLDPVSVNGDPIFSNTALYDVTLTTPASMVVVTTGRAIAEEPADDQVRRRFVSGPVRDFTVVADDDFGSVSHEVDGTTVTSYFNPAHAGAGQRVLDFATTALETYGRLFGVYPYRELDLVDIDLQGASGVEFPQLVFIGDDLYNGATNGMDANYLEFVVAHEVSHQWWYALVGNNQYRHAFMDEGLADYSSSKIYFAAAHDADLGQREFDLEIKLWYLRSLFESGRVGDQIVDEPTDDYPSQGAYAVAVYAKAALGFDAIRTAIGDDAFFAALRDYAARYRFAVAEPDDLRAAFERASGQDLGELWRHWFDAAEGTQDFSDNDYLELMVDLGLR